MSERTDELLNQMKGFLIHDGHGSAVKVGDTGFGLICNQIADEIVTIEAERDAWKATATKLADQQARHLNLQNHDRVETLTPEEILHNSGAPEEDA